MIDKQTLIDDFIAEHPEYAKKQLEIEIYDGKYDINMIKKNGKKEWIRTLKLKDAFKVYGYCRISRREQKIERQIRIAFEQAEKEVEDLHQRTREGIETARLNGKQIGQRPGNKLHVKKEAPAKEMILKYSKAFNGSNTDEECMKLIRIARNMYYKYKKELKHSN